MFDFFAQVLFGILLLTIIAIVGFGLWVLWQVGSMLKSATRAAREAGLRARNDNYSREQLYKNIAYYELRGDKQAAAYWQDILDRKNDR